MLPQTGALEIDPDERLEREAEETAQRVMRGGELGVKPLSQTEYHIQRIPEGTAEFYEGVIDAIKRESALTDDDVERIKDEVAQDVAGTDYAGAKGHDELNVKVLEKAQQKAQQKAEELGAVDKVNKTLAESDLVRGNNESGNIDSLTDGEKSAMDVVHEQAQVEKTLDELDAELSSLLSDENIRLTATQESEIKSLQQKLAEQFDSPVAELVITWLLDNLTGAATSVTSLSALFAKEMGAADASTAAGAIVMAVSMGLALFVKTITTDYDVGDDTGAENDPTGVRE
ncbi:hypothetical protein C499_00565 [Halogeometricum borinquense DSM 11551]|uniref:Uncharacterized protein n=1 Tax=Halogeometricum borinquense (strain ATCC 700274 / DSM 11551 / JCM 10706 / KCTC 4070 / PR3) TaxID=469382 RepID=E4NVX0_HALBP|nr:hypothetical protein [Halogeometricum borinquense]ADQ69190.1 hypothetical protein Hbor_38760 [Halogeometricum borinquense DSM 11551]ELY31605.1 hypothetical protein C499_00565 [Halogeometricum borinquense DSM 11551]